MISIYDDRDYWCLYFRRCGNTISIFNTRWKKRKVKENKNRGEGGHKDKVV